MKKKAQVNKLSLNSYFEVDSRSIGGVTLNTPVFNVGRSGQGITGQTYSQSTHYEGAYGADKAFDGTVSGGYGYLGDGNFDNTTGAYNSTYNTSVDGANLAGEWLQVNVGKKVAVTSYKIYPQNWEKHSIGGRSPHIFKLVYSDDGTNFLTADSQTVGTDSNDTSEWATTNDNAATYIPKTFTLTNTKIGQYWRLIVTSVYGNSYSNGGYVSIQELELNGSDDYTGSGDPVIVNAIAGENSPKDFSLFASNDNINWSKINSWTDLSNVDYYDDVNEEFKTLELPITETNRYQFWRLVVNKITGGTSLQLSELRLHGFYEETNFSIITEGIKFNYDNAPASGSSRYSGTYTYSNAFNEQNDQWHWMSSAGSYDTDGIHLLTQRQFDNYKGEWLQIDLALPKKTYFFKIWPKNDTLGASAPSSFRLYGSLNGSDWYAIKDWNGLTSDHYYSGGNYTPFIAKLDEPVSYRFYRLVINKATSNSNSTLTVVSICELELYGNEYVEYTEPTILYYGTSNPSEGSTIYINQGFGPPIIDTRRKQTIIDKISGVCNGQTILASSGTSYLLENVTNSQELSTSYQNIIGSKINYVPPVDTTNILYSFNALIAYRETTNNYGNNRTVIEKIGGQCRGQSLTTSYGSTTLTNVTGAWSPSTSYQIIPGSQITYRPPTGTTELKYKFKFQTSYIDTGYILHFRLYVDNTEMTDFRTTYRDNNYGEDVVDLEFTFRIGQGNNYTYGMWNDWSSNKTIDVRVREYSSGYDGQIHATQHWDGGGGDQFRPHN